MAAKCMLIDDIMNKYSRFFDVDQEREEMLQPIEGYQNLPLVSLEEAVKPIVFCCPDIHQHVNVALSSCERPSDELDQNESAAIYLYTMEWEPIQKCLYFVLNSTLRNGNRNKLKPWFSYLKLILTALHKIPSKKETIWRCIPCDLSQQYEIGKCYVWWAFSSCIKACSTVESNEFLGKFRSRTLFNIECQNGKLIQSHSSIGIADEILLLPAMQFEVKRKFKPTHDLSIIELKEIEPLIPLIELPFNISTVQSIDKMKMKKQQLSNNCQNRNFKRKLAKYSFNDKVELYEQEVTDDDIPFVCQVVINKNCLELLMRRNKIGDKGAKYLGEMLQSNTTLQVLDILKNQLSNVGVRWITEALHKNTTLTELDLGWNHITDEGALLISEVLCNNTILKELHLYNNSIGDNGVQHLAHALTQNRTLTVLSVGDNEITEEGLIYLAEMIKQNSTLIELNLDENPLTNHGMMILMDALCYNRRLETLWIKFWNISDHCVSDIQKMLKRNTTLMLLCLTRKSFSNQVQRKLEAISERNVNGPIFFSDWNR